MPSNWERGHQLPNSSYQLASSQEQPIPRQRYVKLAALSCPPSTDASMRDLQISTTQPGSLSLISLNPENVHSLQDGIMFLVNTANLKKRLVAPPDKELNGFDFCGDITETASNNLRTTVTCRGSFIRQAVKARRTFLRRRIDLSTVMSRSI